VRSSPARSSPGSHSLAGVGVTERSAFGRREDQCLRIVLNVCEMYPQHVGDKRWKVRCPRQMGSISSEHEMSGYLGYHLRDLQLATEHVDIAPA